MNELLNKFYYKYSILRIILYPAVFVRRLFSRKISNLKVGVLSNLSELLYEDPVLRVDEFNGVFVIDSHSHLFKRLVLEKKYEPELVECCEKFLDRDRDVIDVGANVGFFTVFFAKQLNDKQRVLSIEPTKKALRRLYHNIGINGVQDKVVVFEGVASNQKGSVEIKIIPGKEEYSSMGAMKHTAIINENYETEVVKGLSIDELVESYLLDPGFIKVDVEGVEHLVFEGAREVLKRRRPIIMSELNELLLSNNESSSMEIVEMFKSFEYEVVDPINPSGRIWGKNYGDILCIPKESNFRL